jgi:hypothetical protein
MRTRIDNKWAKPSQVLAHLRRLRMQPIDRELTTDQTNLQHFRTNNASSRPLTAALIHLHQAKLLLRRSRRDTLSNRSAACLTRVLDGVRHLCAAVEHLVPGENSVYEVIQHLDRELEYVSAGGLQ